MKRLFNLILVLFVLLWALPVFGQARIQRITRIRDNTTNNMADVLNLDLSLGDTTIDGLVTGSSNYYFDTTGNIWRYWYGMQSATSLTSLPRAPFTLDVSYLYSVGDTDLRIYQGDAMDQETVSSAYYAPFDMTFDYAYDATSGNWRWVNIVNTHADGLALSLNGKVSASFLYLYNGATMDLWPSTANGGAQVGLEEWHSSYDDANGLQHISKKDVAVYDPAATTGTAVDDSAGGDLGDEVLASFFALDLINITIYVDNAGGGSGDNLLYCYVLASPSGAAGTWSSIDGWNDCDGLTSGGGTCHLQISGNSHAYLKAECICDTGEDTTVDAYVVGNKG